MKYLSIFIIFTLLTIPVFSKDMVTKVEIVGNDIISDSAVISKIKTRVNQEYNDNSINDDIKNLYSTGFFDDIKVEKKKDKKGVKVVFNLKEKPVIDRVIVNGTKKIHKKKIEALIDIEEGSFLDEYKIKEIENSIEELYRKKGFSAAKIVSQIKINEGNKAKITFEIDESGVIRVKKIIIRGNNAISTKKIKKLIRTKEKSFFRKGIFKKEALEDDVLRIEDIYREKGFGEISIDYALDYLNDNVYLTINVEEGARYFIGRIKIEGNDEILTKELRETITVKNGDVFVERKINESLNAIRGIYIDKGYIFAQFRPIVFLNPETEKIDITFNIIENDFAYVEKIEIRGNVKTKDKVIRRELRVYPGDKFEGEKIRKSRERLDNLGFFEEVRFDSEPGSEESFENLIVEVKESKTGYVSFGGGYSSIDQFTGFIELRQRNFDYKNWPSLTGDGQDLSLVASLGSVSEKYELSFTKPWIFDKPLSFGFDGYKKGHKRESDVGYGYDESIKGGAVRLGKEFNDELSASVGYRIEQVIIGDVDDSASAELKREEGTNDLSSLEFFLTYDSRNNVFVPSSGILLSNSLKVTGGLLGGDKDYFAYSLRLSKFYEFIKKSVLEIRFRGGFADSFENTTYIPIYSRFFAGGANSIRGYDERSIGPIDPITKDPIGGESMFATTIEYTYPLVKILKLAAFFDSGNVWAKGGDFLTTKLYSSVGLGVRVKTPMGPINLDYGIPLDIAPGETGKEGKFHFSISRGF